MNPSYPVTGRSPSAELAQAVERNALLHTHPAAVNYPDLDEAIAAAQDQVDALAAEVSATDDSGEGTAPSPSTVTI
jgi:hypothetical protein